MRNILVRGDCTKQETNCILENFLNRLFDSAKRIDTSYDFEEVKYEFLRRADTVKFRKTLNFKNILANWGKAFESFPPLLP